MPQIIFSPSAIQDLERLRIFLSTKSPEASKSAATTMLKTIQLLENQPKIGRPVEDMDPEYRELLIRFGSSGYIAIYHFVRNAAVA